MTFGKCSAALATVVLATASFIATGIAQTATPASVPVAASSTAQPVSVTDKDRLGEPWWAARHEAILAEIKSDPYVGMIYVGDSITHFWGAEPKSNPVNGPKAWQEVFGSQKVLNLGFGWDRTQNVVWRLEQGEFDSLTPKTVILNIGTNNLTSTVNARSKTPEEIVQGIQTILHEVRGKSPTSRIIVMGIFPRGFSATNDFRAPILKLNALLAASLATEPNTTFLDIGQQFLAPDGTLPKELFSDGTHPTEAGYSIWAKALIAIGIRK